MLARHFRTLVLLFALVSLGFIPLYAHAQADQGFLTTAIPLAQQSQRETGIPASITLAQAIWETGSGRSPIGDANNYFGIKAAGASDAQVNIGPVAEGWVWAWTKEWDGKRYITSRERFRKYHSMEESFRDHGILLATTARYALAMQSLDNPRLFARRIADAGYATSPTYAADLIALMDSQNLYQYDLPRNAAQFLGQSDTVTVHSGEIFQIYFDVQNTGFGTWSPTADYYLANINNQPLGTNGQQQLTELVAPDRVKRWALTMIAPSAAGTYTTTWQLRHGAAAFGPQMSLEVNTVAPPSTPVWQIVAGVGGLALLIWGVVWFALRRNKQKSPAPFWKGTGQ